MSLYGSIVCKNEVQSRILDHLYAGNEHAAQSLEELSRNASCECVIKYATVGAAAGATVGYALTSAVAKRFF